MYFSPKKSNILARQSTQPTPSAASVAQHLQVPIEDKRLKWTRKCTVVTDFFRRTQYPVSYTIVVWTFAHRVDTLFCILYTLSAPGRRPLSGALSRSPALFLPAEQGFHIFSHP